MKKSSNFKNFANKVKEAKEIQKKEKDNSLCQTPSYRYLQVRIEKEDACRFKSILSSKGLSLQSVIIEAINLWMCEHGCSPIADPGTSRANMDT